MNIFRNSSVVAFVFTALFAALYTAPAGAMGHSGARVSGAPVPPAESQDRASEQAVRTEARMQAQIEALRKEMEELKARLALAGND